MKTLLTVLLFLAFYSLCISQKKEFANYAELKKGLPPDSSISDHFKYLDSNRILNAELKIDSATTVYFLIENKINGTKYYWLVLSPEAQSNIIRSIIPQNLTSKKIRFVEEFVLPEYKNILELEIDEEMEECFYNITKKIPLNFSLNVISNLLFEVLFSFYEQQTTYPYVSTPARGNKFEGISFSYSGKTKLYKTYQFEFRPAIIIQSYLMGFDLGFHIRKKIIENLFLAPGLIFHYTVAIQTGGHSGSASRDGWFAFPSLTVGVAILKSLSILITYNYAQINNYYNSFSPTLLKREQRNLDSVIRLALEFGKQN